MTFTRIALAASFLAAASMAVQSQTVTLIQGGGITSLADPYGSGRTAQLEFLGGYGQLDLSNGGYDQTGDTFDLGGATGFLGVARATVIGTSGANVQEAFVSDPFDGNVRVDVGWQSPSASAMTVRTDNLGSFDSVSLVGGLQISGTRITGTLTGGTLTLSNVRVDFANQQIIADVSGTRAATSISPAVSFGQAAVPVWTFASVTGPTGISPTALLSTDPVAALATEGITVVQSSATPIYGTTGCFSGGSGLGYPGGSGGYWYPCTQQIGTSNYVVARADLSLGSLQMTTTAMNLITNSLGLWTTGVNALMGPNTETPNQWGNLHVGMFFRTGDLTASGWPAIPGAIPEPSTYALMGLGLVGVAAVARRRAVART